MVNHKMAEASVAEQMAKLRNDYLARLPAELSALKKLSAGLDVHENKRTVLDELYHRLHKLAGSGGTFGLATLSARARSLEYRVKKWLENVAVSLGEQARQAFEADISELVTTLAEAEVPFNMPVSVSMETASSKIQRVWLVEDDAELAREIMRQLESFNYLMRLFASIGDAERAAQTEQPDILIMDVMFGNEGETSTQVLSQRPNLHKLTCPLLFISSSDDFQSRVRSVQLGAQGYCLKPLDVPRLVNRMVQIEEQRRAPPQRVLLVDDDEALAAHYRLVLMSAGMEVEVLHQPEMILDKISAFRPELVLMDLHMPVYSGPDLAGVIRQHEKWASLPLVYLSAETDIDKQIKAMDQGADDFLTKPISDSHLIAAVRVRIERARQLDMQISRDSLTGLLKHASIKDAVEMEVLRARRVGKPASVAMLDIDHFKKVNDTYGHAVGDIVISSIAMLLRQRMRHSDIIGRYGGEEFVVMMPECDIENAKLLLEDIRQRFSAVHFNHDGKDFSCTISSGIACTAHFPDSKGAELLNAADAALYVAKRGGRNQVQAAPVDLMQEGSRP